MILIGAGLFLVGIAFNLFGIGVKVSEFFSNLFNKKQGDESSGEDKLIDKEDVKDIVKEEVQKAKVKEGLRDNIKDIVKDELNKSKDKEA